jgi:competence protein ComGC
MKFFSKTAIFVLLLAYLVNAQTQCQAITKKGTQCKRKAVVGSIYCAQHSKMSNVETVKSQAPVKAQRAPQKNETVKQGKTQSENAQCQAITKKGKRCTRKVKAGSKYCWQHQYYN